ncbi:major facilitator superfamily permease [Nitratireductor aquibiodomus RA22]|uniref:Major facilitator superfamily permease n=1 Tax=Nitratireductor aquibiodomus RA22 TaxID=1189611 RepID=I5BVF8_9HYPH|nr:MFS transporter [Nitratireductor aquibiodomus]EIM73560.1 major facilitator superfamily permease [Nitratireductor aquibiodomus RA22]
MTFETDRHHTGVSQPFTMSETTASRKKAGPIEWTGLAVLALPPALLGLDMTLLYLALPALAGDLRPSSTQALWIMDAYGFMIAGFLITMGTLGDRIGRRRLLMIGATAFGAASVLAAFSPTANTLIAARAVLGVAGATLMPSTLALISNMFLQPSQRALAIGVWATMFALGMALGPLVGGILLSHYWWGSAFLVALPVVAIVLIAGPWLLPEYRAPASGRFDLPSVALSLATILPVAYFVKESAKTGLTPVAVLALMTGVICGAIFVRRQRSLSSPLLDVQLFGNGTFSAALGILLFGLVGVGGAMLLVTQYLQLVLDLPPVIAGLWMGPPAFMMIVAGIGAPLLARKIRPAFVMAGSLAISAIGYLLLATLAWMPGLTPVTIGYALVYLGLGTIAALGTDLVVGATPPEKAGSASAMSESVQELGIALGVALFGSLTTLVYRNAIFERLSYDLPQDVFAAFADSLWAASTVATPVAQDLIVGAKASFVAGMSASAAIAAVGVVVLSILCAWSLRRVPKLK